MQNKSNALETALQIQGHLKNMVKKLDAGKSSQVNHKYDASHGKAPKRDIGTRQMNSSEEYSSSGSSDTSSSKSHLKERGTKRSPLQFRVDGKKVSGETTTYNERKKDTDVTSPRVQKTLPTPGRNISMPQATPQRPTVAKPHNFLKNALAKGHFGDLPFMHLLHKTAKVKEKEAMYKHPVQLHDLTGPPLLKSKKAPKTSYKDTVAHNRMVKNHDSTIDKLPGDDSHPSTTGKQNKAYFVSNPKMDNGASPLSQHKLSEATLSSEGPFTKFDFPPKQSYKKKKAFRTYEATDSSEIDRHSFSHKVDSDILRKGFHESGKTTMGEETLSAERIKDDNVTTYRSQSAFPLKSLVDDTSSIVVPLTKIDEAMMKENNVIVAPKKEDIHQKREYSVFSPRHKVKKLQPSFQEKRPLALSRRKKFSVEHKEEHSVLFSPKTSKQTAAAAAPTVMMVETKNISESLPSNNAASSTIGIRTNGETPSKLVSVTSNSSESTVEEQHLDQVQQPQERKTTSKVDTKRSQGTTLDRSLRSQLSTNTKTKSLTETVEKNTTDVVQPESRKGCREETSSTAHINIQKEPLTKNTMDNVSNGRQHDVSNQHKTLEAAIHSPRSSPPNYDEISEDRRHLSIPGNGERPRPRHSRKKEIVSQTSGATPCTKNSVLDEANTVRDARDEKRKDAKTLDLVHRGSQFSTPHHNKYLLPTKDAFPSENIYGDEEREIIPYRIKVTDGTRTLHRSENRNRNPLKRDIPQKRDKRERRSAEGRNAPISVTHESYEIQEPTGTRPTVRTLLGVVSPRHSLSSSRRIADAFSLRPLSRRHHGEENFVHINHQDKRLPEVSSRQRHSETLNRPRVRETYERRTFSDHRRSTGHGPPHTKDDFWYYKDCLDVTQGPFTSALLLRWIRKQFFANQPHVRFRRCGGRSYMSLTEVIPSLNRAVKLYGDHEEDDSDASYGAPVSESSVTEKECLIEYLDGFQNSQLEKLYTNWSTRKKICFPDINIILLPLKCRSVNDCPCDSIQCASTSVQPASDWACPPLEVVVKDETAFQCWLKKRGVTTTEYRLVIPMNTTVLKFASAIFMDIFEDKNFVKARKSSPRNRRHSELLDTLQEIKIRTLNPVSLCLCFRYIYGDRVVFQSCEPLTLVCAYYEAQRFGLESCISLIKNALTDIKSLDGIVEVAGLAEALDMWDLLPSFCDILSNCAYALFSNKLHLQLGPVVFRSILSSRLTSVDEIQLVIVSYMWLEAWRECKALCTENFWEDLKNFEENKEGRKIHYSAPTVNDFLSIIKVTDLDTQEERVLMNKIFIYSALRLCQLSYEQLYECRYVLRMDAFVLDALFRKALSKEMERRLSIWTANNDFVLNREDGLFPLSVKRVQTRKLSHVIFKKPSLSKKSNQYIKSAPYTLSVDEEPFWSPCVGDVRTIVQLCIGIEVRFTKSGRVALGVVSTDIAALIPCSSPKSPYGNVVWYFNCHTREFYTALMDPQTRKVTFRLSLTPGGCKEWIRDVVRGDILVLRVDVAPTSVCLSITLAGKKPSTNDCVVSFHFPHNITKIQYNKKYGQYQLDVKPWIELIDYGDIVGIPDLGSFTTENNKNIN